MGGIYVVASGKGGTGKTTVCAGLSCALAKRGRRVLAVDFDSGQRNLDLALGLQDSTVFDFEDVLRGRAEASDAITQHPAFPGLFFLPAPIELYVPEKEGEFEALISKLSADFDYCLIDAPAGIDSAVYTAARAADRAILVSTPDTPGLSDGGGAARLLRRAGIGEIKLVINRYSPGWAKKRRCKNIDESIDATGVSLMGIIPEDHAAARAMNTCVPLLSSGSRRAAPAIMDAALRLEGIPVRSKL